MGWSPFSWLFGEKEAKLPEQLVLGAELECPYGTEHSYLFVQSGDIDINGLPEACVTDREKSVNIMPFGYCTYIWANCSMIMELEEQWENEEPQRMLSNGKEIITTRSTLLCRACGGEIRAVTSGQDGVEAARIANEIELVREMEEKYPGLLDILGNPYGSLYLEEGMYQMALQFLEERVDKNGGDIWILGLYSGKGLENTLIRSCLEQLLTVSGVEREKSVIEKLNVMGLKNGKEPGWDVHSLNKEMIGLLEQRCEDTAKKIKTNDNYRWAEENKQQLDWYTEKLTEFAYLGLIYYWSMNLGQPKEYKQEAEAENAKKLEATEEKVGESETEATVESEGGYGKSSESLDWDAVVGRRGETRRAHVALHETNDLSKASHGVFYGDSVSTINKAWDNRANGYMISQGNTDLYIIPYQNAGYAGGYGGQGNNLNYVTIVTQKGTTNIITGFPGNGYQYTLNDLIGGG